MEKSKELSILVYSCERNIDMWEENGPFTQLLRKYWKECNYKIILLTDHISEGAKADSVFDEIAVLDGTWHEMIMEGIRVADTPYIMLWMDDYLLCDYVDNTDIEKQLLLVKKYSAGNLRLTESNIAISEPYPENSKLGYYKQGTAYSISTQVGIWGVEFLQQYMRPEWSAWEFERKGSIEIKDERYPLLVALDYTFPYEEGIRKGKWMDNGIRLCKRNGIHPNLSRRKAMTSMEMAWIYFKGGILEWNPTLVLKLQNFLKG